MRNLLTGLLLLCFASGFVPSAFADEAVEVPLVTSETPAKAEQELPSFFPKSYDLGIYTLVVFGLMMLILYRFAWPHISAGLAAREANILNARDEAIKSQREVEELRAKLKAEYAQANEKIRGMMEEARRDAEALRAKEKEAGAKDAANERERAKREIDSAKEQALQELYQSSIKLASLMSSKAIRRELSAEDHARLLDESLKEIQASV